MKWTEKALSGGALATVMGEVMLTGKLRAKFAALAGKPGTRLDAPLRAYESYYGWKPARELAEWSAVEKAYLKFIDSISDSWIIGMCPLALAAKPKPVSKVINDRDFILSLFTGLQPLGQDPSGDSCFVSTLPTSSDLAEVYVFNHENGELDGDHSGSLAHFVAAHFSPLNDDDDEEESTDDEDLPWTKTARAFGKGWDKTLKKRPVQDAPQRLFDRAKWMFDLPSGEAGYAFAERLGEGATFATWKKEIPLLAKHYVLTNYWLLAHYFLGNVDACRQAIAIGKKCRGEVTPELAKIVEALLDKPDSAKLGKITPEVLKELREATAKNCDPSQLDPAAAKTITAARAPSGKTGSPKEIKARLAKGEDAWSIIAEFPDDVSTHDLVLTELAAKTTDKKLKENVKRYFSERTDDPYNTWPYRAEDYDRRFTPAVSAAFRSGLKYDSDHKAAFPSLANTLAFADDDTAMNAFEEAIDKLDGADDRLEYVIEALQKSTHARAPEVLERGALKFFTTIDAAAKRLKKKDAEGPTLNNMFDVETHLVQALHILLRRRDERARALAKKTLSYNNNLRLFGSCIGHAARVASKFGDKECVPSIHDYFQAVLAHWDEVDNSHDYIAMNATECALALAQLEPEMSAPILRVSFDRKREVPATDLDAKAALLTGLLWLNPKDETWLAWLERFLGDRSGSMRVYAGLRAVEECNIAQAKAWVKAHLYGRRTSLNEPQTGYWIFAETARNALVALGEDRPPPFDDDDEFAVAVKLADLPAALGQPERYRIGSVFEKIREKKYINPKVIEKGREVLLDLYRYAGDEPDRGGLVDDTRVEGVRALFLQGAASADAFGELIELPQIDSGNRSFLTIVQRFCGQEGAVRSWLATASKSELLAEIAHPRRVFHAFVDLIAARAMSEHADDDCRRLCVEAFERHVAAAGDEGNYAPLHHLAYVVANIDAGRAVIERLLKEGSLYHFKHTFTRALTLSPSDLAHDFDKGELALGVMLGSKDYSEDCRPTQQFTLSVKGSAVHWHTIATGYSLGMHGILDTEAGRGAYESRGEISFRSPAEAKEHAQRELRAATLLGYRVPEKRSAKKTKKR